MYNSFAFEYWRPFEFTLNACYIHHIYPQIIAQREEICRLKEHLDAEWIFRSTYRSSHTPNFFSS